VHKIQNKQKSDDPVTFKTTAKKFQHHTFFPIRLTEWSHFSFIIVLEGPLSRVVKVGASNCEMSVSMLYVGAAPSSRGGGKMSMGVGAGSSSSGSLSII